MLLVSPAGFPFFVFVVYSGSVSQQSVLHREGLQISLHPISISGRLAIAVVRDCMQVMGIF